MSNIINTEKKHLKVVVLGMGNYGTAMAYAASRNGHHVVGWCRDTKQAASINKQHVNSKYLSSFTLPTNIHATSDIASAMIAVDLIIHALPCQSSPEWYAEHKALIPSDVLICSTCKGLYLKTAQLIGVAIADALGNRGQPFAYLSGPSFAKEIMQDQPTAVVVASSHLAQAQLVADVMTNRKFKTYISTDIIGVQVGGALKNPLAVGAGMIAGLDMGMNTLTAYVTRGAAELSALSVAMGGDPSTIAGLAGIGDLMLTCMSAQSRNQTCGRRLVKGEKIEAILQDMTVEGVPTAAVAVAMADKFGLDMPIFRTVNAIITGDMQAECAVDHLMGIEAGLETRC